MMSFRRRFFMKRKSFFMSILLCFCLILILFLFGTCGDEGETTKEENGGTEPPITNEVEPPTNGGVEPPPGPGISFAEDIKPIFDEKCNLPFCHGANPISGLLLTSYDNFKNGGNSGPGFIPKNSADSKIMEKIKASFKITEQSLENLKLEDVPDDVLERLQSLENQEFTEEEDFLNKLDETIGDEQTVKFKLSILKHAKIKPGMPPGGELPEAERNKIKDWIDAGGENN